MVATVTASSGHLARFCRCGNFWRLQPFISTDIGAVEIPAVKKVRYMFVFDDYELSLPLHEYSVCTRARWSDFGWLFLSHFLLVCEVHQRVDLCQWYSCHQILSAVYLACYLWFDNSVLEFSSNGKTLPAVLRVFPHYFIIPQIPTFTGCFARLLQHKRTHWSYPLC